jgi:predicted GNAT family acetyltransferase
VPDVIDLPEQSRFELNVDGRVAELVYRVEGRHLVLVHTEVPEALGGQGIGGRLVQAAVERAAAEGLTPSPGSGWSATPTPPPASPSMGTRAKPAGSDDGSNPRPPGPRWPRSHGVEPVLYSRGRNPVVSAAWAPTGPPTTPTTPPDRILKGDQPWPNQ